MMIEQRTAAIVCDAGPIIHLDELECLRLLNDFRKIILPEVVYEEVCSHRPESLEKAQLNFIRESISGPMGEELVIMSRVFSLDAGEISALGVMEKNPQAIFLTDDCAARLVAERMGYNVHGTIGILLRAIRRKLLHPREVHQLLTELPRRSSLHIRDSLLDEIILDIKERFKL